MLSSFERPAPRRADRPLWDLRAPVRGEAFSAVLENCTVEPKKYGYHRAGDGPCPRVRTWPAQITVKIVRADGGCLGTRSR